MTLNTESLMLASSTAYTGFERLLEGGFSYQLRKWFFLN